MNDALSVNQVFTAWGQRLREARKAAGLAQLAVAQSSGLEQSDVSRIEAGQRQTLPRFLVVTRALGLTVVDLADGNVDQVEVVVSDALGVTVDELRDLVRLLDRAGVTVS